MIVDDEEEDRELSSGVIVCFDITERNASTLKVFAAVANLLNREFKLYSFIDDEMFTACECLLLKERAKKVLVREDWKRETLETMVSKLKVSVSIFAKKCTNKSVDSDSIQQDVEKLIHVETGVSKSLFLSQIAQSFPLKTLNPIIEHYNMMQTARSQYSIAEAALDQHVKLDSTAISSLQILPEKLSDRSPSSSLLSLFNHTKTPAGKRLLESWFCQPLTSITDIEQRLNICEYLTHDSELLTDLSQQLKTIPDYAKLSAKFIRGKGTLKDVYQVYASLLYAERVQNVLNDHELFSDIARSILENLKDFTRFVELVETVVDLKKAGKGEFLISSTFDDRLGELGEEMQRIEKNFDARANKIGDILDIDQVRWDMSNSTHGYTFRIKKSAEPKLRKRKDFEIVQVSAQGVRFTNGGTRTMSNELIALKEKYEKQQSEVMKDVIEVVRGYAEPMLKLGSTLAIVDCYFALATTVSNSSTPYCRPKMLQKGSDIIKMTALRHACLEVHPNISFIANDVSLNSASKFGLITGPNMGGKTIYCKSIAIAVLLAHIGCYVPAQEATITIVDAIYTRVGASDHLSRGVSTFMAEMLESAAIVKSATSNSLIIIDELGRGTSTYDGFGLAWAISEHLLTETNAFCLFATHYHELTELAELYKVKNLCTEAVIESNDLVFLYRVKHGVSQHSLGIEIARMCQLPDAVCEDAKQMLSSLNVVEWHGDVRVRAEGMAVVGRYLKELSSCENMPDFNRLTQKLRNNENAFVQQILSSQVAQR